MDSNIAGGAEDLDNLLSMVSPYGTQGSSAGGATGKFKREAWAGRSWRIGCDLFVMDGGAY
jgi:hypothetical protein